MNRKIQVMLVEDHPEYREVIQLAIDNEADLELSSQFGSAEQALRSLQDRDLRKEPDLILLDLNLPRLSGLEALPYFSKAIPSAKIIILTQSNKEADVMCGIQRGASGYLLKSSTVKQITDAIRSVAGGGAILDSSVAGYILSTLQNRPAAVELGQELTARELEILSLLAEGFLKKQIADQLDITHSTVSMHIVHIYEKLAVQNAPAAVHRAHRLGLFPKGN